LSLILLALTAVLATGCGIPIPQFDTWFGDSQSPDARSADTRYAGEDDGEGAGSTAPSGATVNGKFVASARGSVYYWVGCDSWRSLAANNLRWFETAAEAESAGFRASTARGCQDPDVHAGPSPVETGVCTVARIVDGDTVTCAEGASRVRLLLVDAPESAQGEYGTAARQTLEGILPPGTAARVELDKDRYDQYGRILAYLYTPDGRMVNEELVRSGFAAVLVYLPNNRYERRMTAASEEAQRAGRGLWGTGGFECEPAKFRRGECDP
jgi:micrococcal nuclease